MMGAIVVLGFVLYLHAIGVYLAKWIEERRIARMAARWYAVIEEEE